MLNQKSTFNHCWKIMQSFRALNTSSGISSQPESRGMPWRHFVAWLHVSKSFCQKFVPNVTNTCIFSMVFGFCDFAYAFCCHLKCRLLRFPFTTILAQSHQLSSQLAGVCHHLALSNSMVAKCKALLKLKI